MTLASRALRSPIGWAMLLLVVMLVCASVFAIVPESDQAVIVRMGRPDRIVNGFAAGGRIGDGGAGLIARIPFVDDLYLIDKRMRSVSQDGIELVSSDGQPLAIDAYARYRIVDPLRLYLAVQGDPDALDAALRPALQAAIRSTFASHDEDAILTADSSGLVLPAEQALDRAARRYGVAVVAIGVRRVTLPGGAPLDAAYQRMRQRWQQQAAAVKADGSREAASVRSDADADAAKVYAKSYGQDPAFYDFYRAMQSYRQTFGVDQPAKGKTTMILSPDSEYLRYFRSRGK